MVCGEEKMRQTCWVSVPVVSVVMLLPDVYLRTRWQKLRFAEVSFEKETMESLLAKLTAEERDLRKRLEDAVDSHSKTSPLQTFTPLQPLNGKTLANGNPTPKLNGDSGGKKGKKRKQEAH